MSNMFFYISYLFEPVLLDRSQIGAVIAGAINRNTSLLSNFKGSIIGVSTTSIILSSSSNEDLDLKDLGLPPLLGEYRAIGRTLKG